MLDKILFFLVIAGVIGMIGGVIVDYPVLVIVAVVVFLVAVVTRILLNYGVIGG
jgi:hypothetical protein